MEQIKKTTFNADGLQLVFISLLLSLVSGVFSGMAANNHAEGLQLVGNLGGGGVSIASVVLMIMGLSKMMKYSKRFALSRKFYIAELILAVAGAFILGILGAIAFFSVQSGMEQISTVAIVGILFFVVLLGWIVAMVIVALKAMKYLLHGCAELADAVKERELAGKLRGIYTLYLISVLVFFGAVVLFIVLLIASVNTNTLIYTNPSPESLLMNMGGAATIGSILLIAAGIFMLVVNILIVVKIYQAKEAINGQPIPGIANTRTAPMASGTIPAATATRSNAAPAQTPTQTAAPMQSTQPTMTSPEQGQEAKPTQSEPPVPTHESTPTGESAEEADKAKDDQPSN